jgi:ABC-type Mn2+/Zn2+ transport system permease subunit
LVGIVSTAGSALIGLAIGHMFNGSIVPLVSACIVLTMCSLAIASYTETPAREGSR